MNINPTEEDRKQAEKIVREELRSWINVGNSVSKSFESKITIYAKLIAAERMIEEQEKQREWQNSQIDGATQYITKLENRIAELEAKLSASPQPRQDGGSEKKITVMNCPPELRKKIIGSHFVNLKLRLNGEDVEVEADWLKEFLLQSLNMEAIHASAPMGYKCADCTIDNEPCIGCYSTWWKKRHPNWEGIRS
jgi:hypothetical protein